MTIWRGANDAHACNSGQLLSSRRSGQAPNFHGFMGFLYHLKLPPRKSMIDQIFADSLHHAPAWGYKSGPDPIVNGSTWSWRYERAIIHS